MDGDSVDEVVPSEAMGEVKYKWGVQHYFNTPLYAYDFSGVILPPYDGGDIPEFNAPLYVNYLSEGVAISLCYNGSIFLERRLAVQWGVRVSLGYFQMRYSRDVRYAFGGAGKIHQSLHYCTPTLTLRHYMDTERRFCIFMGPYAAIPFYACNRYEDDLPRGLPYTPRLERLPLQWSDLGFGVKLGVDYALRSDFLLGVGLNMMRTRISEHPYADVLLCSFNLRLGWNLFYLPADEPIEEYPLSNKQ